MDIEIESAGTTKWTNQYVEEVKEGYKIAVKRMITIDNPYLKLFILLWYADSIPYENTFLKNFER